VVILYINHLNYYPR